MSLKDDFSNKIKIIQTLRRANQPLIKLHIAKRCKLSPQIVDYHLAQMADWGIVIISTVEDKSFYQLQKAYYNDQLLEKLSKMLIPYMEKISKDMEFSQVKSSMAEAVTKNLFMLIRLFEAEIERSFQMDNKENLQCS